MTPQEFEMIRTGVAPGTEFPEYPCSTCGAPSTSWARDLRQTGTEKPNKYEYKTLALDATTAAILAILGAEGWEAVCVLPCHYPINTSGLLLFKRKLIADHSG